MNERLKKLRKSLNLTQQAFADRIGISRGNIAAYEVGKNAISDAVISLICREFDINEEWLRNGTGEMKRTLTRDEEIISFIGKMQLSPDNSYKKRFISMLSRLDESDWKTLEKMAILMLNKEEKKED